MHTMHKIWCAIIYDIVDQAESLYIFYPNNTE